MPRLARSFVLAAAAGCLALPAAARCPATPADAAAGIDITYDDGSSARLRVDAGGLSRSESSYNDGSGIGELLIGRHGYLVTQLWGMKDGIMMSGAVLMREYPDGVLAAPPLGPGETREVAATTVYADVTFEDRLVLSAGPDTVLTIGDCTLRSRQVTVTLATMEPPEVETYQFLPDIGLAFVIAITGGTAPELTLVPERIAVAD